MSDLDRVVDVTITRQTTVPTMASFGTLLIASEFLAASTTPVFGATERVRSYGSLAELVTAGFVSTTFVYKEAVKIFSQNPSMNEVLVGRKLTGADGTETWDTALGAMNVENSAWYGLLVETRVEAEQQTVATWVETAKKLCILYSNDADIVDAASGDIADYLETNNLERTAVIYHSSATDVFADGAFIGKMLVKAPGSATWALKTLAGISAYALTSAQVTQALAKNANIYISIADVDVTQNGTVGSGEYIDVIQGLDWLTARIQNLVFTPLVQLDKVPYTSAGIAIVETQLRTALEEGVSAGVIAEDYTVTVPDIEDVSAVKKAARILPDVTFTATLAGAIHGVEIAGTVSL